MLEAFRVGLLRVNQSLFVSWTPGQRTCLSIAFANQSELHRVMETQEPHEDRENIILRIRRENDWQRNSEPSTHHLLPEL